MGALRENAALVKEAIASCERAEEAIVQEWANAELLLRASNKIISLDALVSAAATAAPAALPPTTGADGTPPPLVPPFARLSCSCGLGMNAYPPSPFSSLSPAAVTCEPLT